MSAGILPFYPSLRLSGKTLLARGGRQAKVPASSVDGEVTALLRRLYERAVRVVNRSQAEELAKALPEDEVVEG